MKYEEAGGYQTGVHACIYRSLEVFVFRCM